ncbi:MAG: hypothetical protein HYX35_05000 [Proteobacteria bacterium]|nr:hypothetical protein [Pseudomonadota bacterium]
MKYFVLTMAVLATVLSTEAVVAQAGVPPPAVQSLTTPGGVVTIPGQAGIPFNAVPALLHATPL